MKIYWRVEQNYRRDRSYRWWWWWRVWMIFKADNICINALPVENMHTSHLHSGPSGAVPSWEGASFLTLKLKAKTVKNAKKFSVDIETPSSGFAKLSWTKLRWAVKPLVRAWMRQQLLKQQGTLVFCCFWFLKRGEGGSKTGSKNLQKLTQSVSCSLPWKTVVTLCTCGDFGVSWLKI